MYLTRICEKVEYKLIQGSLEKDVTDIIYDSRKVSPHTVFVCMVGAVTDGHKYIGDAVKKGASAIVVERADEAEDVPEDVTVIQVRSARYALALMSAAYFDYPAGKLTTIGLTGTKGKTMVSYIIKDVLQKAGKKCGLIGTIAMVIGEKSVPSKNTTPESYEIHKALAEMVKCECSYAIMEVSSQGLKYDRTAGITFDYGIFTNLSPDHIGPTEHPDFEDYLECKSRLFRQCRTGIINIDDDYAEEILKRHTCDVITFSAAGDGGADLNACDIRFLNESGRLGMYFRTTGIVECDAKIHIPGQFSVYNALTTIAVCHKLGISVGAILKGLENVQIKGRVEMVHISENFNVVIDYAHNEVSTRSVLETLKAYNPARLIAVFGCGGNRSKVRRYDIGEVAGELADICILTTDNPRFEKVADINADIKKGLAKNCADYIEIEDRKEAIAYAITHARKGDMIVTLGKGHEDYVEIEGVKHHFSEREAIDEIIGDIKAGKRKMEYISL